ncbi:MAG: RodZ domain-containing protein [Chloroflexota bacterium]
MNELGHILREAREARGLSLAEVESETRINSRFLAALEEGEYQALPTPVHVRGFLRNYSRFLGLDPQPLLDRYAINQERYDEPSQAFQLPEPDLVAHKPLDLPQGQPFFDPVNVEVSTQSRTPGGGGGESAVRLVIIVALIAMIYLIISQFLPRLLNNPADNQAVTESFNELVTDLVNINGDEADTAVADATPEVELQPSSVLTSTSRNIAPTSVPTRPSLPATMEIINLQVDITERTFMEVTVDGDTVFSGIAQRDDSFEWVADEEVIILTGNAIGVNVTINDVNIGRLGERGQNSEDVWRTTN